MSLLRNISTCLRWLFRKEQVDQELNEELGAYLEMAAEEKMKGGMSRKEALRAVRLEKGTVEITKEVVRAANWETFVETCWRDVRFGIRTLRKSPGFTAVAVLTLALGLGAVNTIFALVQTVLLRPLNFPHSERVVVVSQNLAALGSGPSVATLGEFQRWEGAGLFEHAAAIETADYVLPGPTSSGQL